MNLFAGIVCLVIAAVVLFMLIGAWLDVRAADRRRKARSVSAWPTMGEINEQIVRMADMGIVNLDHEPKRLKFHAVRIWPDESIGGDYHRMKDIKVEGDGKTHTLVWKFQYEEPFDGVLPYRIATGKHLVDP